ncbi:MAG: hypothetical protein KTR32_05035 [Granulosicoccus sp.]|nr:hypothetical protein [Granulosicoccus sp.]
MPNNKHVLATFEPEQHRLAYLSTSHDLTSDVGRALCFSSRREAREFARQADLGGNLGSHLLSVPVYDSATAAVSEHADDQGISYTGIYG